MSLRDGARCHVPPLTNMIAREHRSNTVDGCAFDDRDDIVIDALYCFSSISAYVYIRRDGRCVSRHAVGEMTRQRLIGLAAVSQPVRPVSNFLHTSLRCAV